MSKLATLWKTMLAGGAGVAALAAMNAVIQRSVPEPDVSALGGDAHFFPWKHGRIFYKESELVLRVSCGEKTSTRWPKNIPYMQLIYWALVSQISPQRRLIPPICTLI